MAHFSRRNLTRAWERALRSTKRKDRGSWEPVYQECLAIELCLRGILFRAKAGLELEYKGRPLEQKHVPDFILFDKIILEIKALSGLHDKHRAQVHNYLKGTGLRLGLLANFAPSPPART